MASCASCASCRVPTMEEIFVYLRRWLVGDRTTLTDHVQLYLILALVTANVDFSVPIMYMALGPLVKAPADIFDLYDTRFYFINQALLFMPIICGYLTDYLGRYSHIVLMVCCVALTALQALTLLPWGDFFPDEECGDYAEDGSIIFCSAHYVLLSIFLIRGVFINQALDQMLKMLSVRASKQFPHDEERKEIEIQRTGTMSDAVTSVVEIIAFGIALVVTDYNTMRVMVTAVGCASTLVVAVLCCMYSTRSFTISRSEQQKAPAGSITARFTDDADSVAASVAEDRLLPAARGRDKLGGGYGATSETHERDGVMSGLSMVDLTQGSGYQAAPDGETAEAASGRAVGGTSPDPAPASDRVVCCKGRCCRGVDSPSKGCDCGPRASCWGKFLLWLYGLWVFATTPVIVLPFIAYLLMQLFNIMVTYPVPQQEANYFNLDDDLVTDDGADPAGDDPAGADDPAGTDDTAGLLSDPITPAFAMRLARIMSTINTQNAQQSGFYLAGSAAYAAFIAEMRPFVFFRYALPAFCAVIAGLMVVYYVPDRPLAASTVIVGLTQVISYFMNEFLQWFLMAVVPESLFGLFTIAQGVGLALMGTVGSQLVLVDPVSVIFLSQLVLGGSAIFSVCASLVAYKRLQRIEEEEEDDDHDAGGAGGAAAASLVMDKVAGSDDGSGDGSDGTPGGDDDLLVVERDFHGAGYQAADR